MEIYRAAWMVVQKVAFTRLDRVCEAASQPPQAIAAEQTPQGKATSGVEERHRKDRRKPFSGEQGKAGNGRFHRGLRHARSEGGKGVARRAADLTANFETASKLNAVAFPLPWYRWRRCSKGEWS